MDITKIILNLIITAFIMFGMLCRKVFKLIITHKKQVLNVFLTTIVMLGIVIITSLSIINKNIEKKHIISKLEEIKIYDQIYDEVQSGFDEYIYQSGLELDALKNVCDKEKIKTDFLAIINGMYNGKETTIDTYIIKQKLDVEINTYLQSQNRTLSPAERINVDRYEDLIADSYGRNISSYISLKNMFNEGVNDIIGRNSFYIFISFVITVASSFAIIHINKPNKYDGVSNLGVALFSSGVLLVFIKSMVTKKIDIENLVILTKVLSNSITYILREMLSLVSGWGKTYICLGLFVIIMTSILGLDTEDDGDFKIHKLKFKNESTEN